MKKVPAILFKEGEHNYTTDGRPVIGVNTYLKNFGFDFDREFWLIYKALANFIPDFGRRFYSRFSAVGPNKPETDYLINFFKKEIDKIDCLGEEIAKVSDSWEESSINGTIFHKSEEDKAYEAGFLINPYTNKKFTVQPKPYIPKGYDNASIVDDLKDLKDGVYLEAILHQLDYGICGTSDETFIETINGVRYVDIGDHKTNKKKPAMNKSNGMCLPPIENLYDCTYVKYALQVSMYAYMLDLSGFVVRHVGIYHYKNYNPKTKKVMMMKYLRKEVKRLLDLRLDALSASNS